MRPVAQRQLARRACRGRPAPASGSWSRNTRRAIRRRSPDTRSSRPQPVELGRHEQRLADVLRQQHGAVGVEAAVAAANYRLAQREAVARGAFPAAQQVHARAFDLDAADGHELGPGR